MRRADAVIVGAGLIGSAAAWYLAKGGAAVEVHEAGHANAGASGQNAGSLHFQIERRFLENGDARAEEASRIVSLSRLAIADWRGLEAALDEDLHVAMTGGLMVAETAAEVALLERKAARERAEGLAVTTIDGDAARAIAPALGRTVIAANYLPDEGHADPRTVTPAFVRRAGAAGARFHFGSRLTGVERGAHGFVLRFAGADAEPVAASRVLLAAGAWSAPLGTLANLHLPIVPVGLTMSATERVPAGLGQLIQHVGQRLSLKQAGSGNLLIGGGWPSRLATLPGGGFDLGTRPALLQASLRANLGVAARIVPGIAGLNLIRTWTGTTAITADQLPVVGEVPALPGFFVAAGGSAFTLGPTFAKLVAAQMLDSGRAQADEALAVVSPARFGHLNSFMG